MIDPNDPSVQRPPDWLIGLRQFGVAAQAAAGAFDQSYVGADGVAYNPTGQFVTVGPQGSSIEGRPVSLTAGGGLALSPGVVLMMLGAAAYWVFTHHKG